MKISIVPVNCGICYHGTTVCTHERNSIGCKTLLTRTLPIDERITNLENKVLSPPGTTISRIISENGQQWSLGIGQMSMPKQFFIGNTIEEIIFQAETFFKDYD